MSRVAFHHMQHDCNMSLAAFNVVFTCLGSQCTSVFFAAQNLDLFASFHLVEAAWKKKVPAALQGAAVNSQMASTSLRFYADVSKLNTGQFKLTCISLLQPASNRIGHRQLDSDCISKIPQALITVARNKQFLLQIASEENRFDCSLWKRLKHRCN